VATYQDGLAALADPTRREVFEKLVLGPLPVALIAAGIPVSRPAVSQHLKVLNEAGLVVDRRVGTRRLYQIDPAGLEALRGYFDRFWDNSLAAFKKAAESSDEEDANGEDRYGRS
jgi:DNA-binding transcriptional ArsR family regulator